MSNMMTRQEIIGRQIRKRRKDLQMTMLTLADSVGCSRGTIYNIENGKNDISMNTLIKMSEILDCNLSYLLGEAAPPLAGGEISVPYEYMSLKDLRVLHGRLKEETRLVALIHNEFIPD